MSNVEKFLKEAFAGESQANRKYTAYAEKADKEGFSQAARLFRAAAAAEAVHATNHLRVMKGIKSEGNKEAEMTFHYANEVEKIHSQLYGDLRSGLATSQETFPYFVCPYCGNTVEKAAPGVCPICGAKGELFMKIE